MARRRTRWTVTLANEQRHVVLAYTHSEATDYFNRKALTLDQRAVLVVPGDYRMLERQAPGGWRVNQANLREAIEFLGLKLPVHIKQVAPRGGGQSGCHRFRSTHGKFMRNEAFDTASGGMYHHITINSCLAPARAGETIWHELCHAMQAEEAAHALPAGATLRDQFNAWYAASASGRGIGYNRKPIEVEACSYEAHNDELPLAL